MSKNLWNINLIQFARLLSEIEAVGLTESQMQDLQESMDLSEDDILELFDRADEVWQEQKGQVL